MKQEMCSRQDDVFSTVYTRMYTNVIPLYK